MGNKQGKQREPIDAQYLRPSGTLYTSCECTPRASLLTSQYGIMSFLASRCLCVLAGDERSLRRLILDRKIAPFYPGSDEPAPDREECPICMLVSAARSCG